MVSGGAVRAVAIPAFAELLISCEEDRSGPCLSGCCGRWSGSKDAEEVGALHVTPRCRGRDNRPRPRQPIHRLAKYRIASMTMMTPTSTTPGKIPKNAESLSAAIIGTSLPSIGPPLAQA
jgi:hypothetical protein